MPSLQNVATCLGWQGLHKVEIGFYFLQRLQWIVLKPLEGAARDCNVCNMTFAICNGFIFPTLQDKFQEQWYHANTPSYSLQSWQAQKGCDISCKEDTLHAAAYLQLASQHHCSKRWKEGKRERGHVTRSNLPATPLQKTNCKKNYVV